MNDALTLRPEAAAAWSRAALDAPLSGAAELLVAPLSGDAIVLGAYQRAGDVTPLASAHALPLVRRASGGPAVRVGAGTLYVGLALMHPAALVACLPAQLVNRYVRPLLRALTRVGARAHFFGRDWVSVERRPAAWIGFAHDATSGRALVEAFVACSSPFALGPRASFLGKEPGTLDAIVGRAIDPREVTEAIAQSFAATYACEIPRAACPDRDGDTAWPSGVAANEPPWAAARDEVIGIVAAGADARGVLRLGGELMASRDAVARLEARVAAGEEIGASVDAELAAPGVAVDGVRSLVSVADVLTRALQKRA